MRRIRYQVAMSLDGYIAGPNGEADWITMDPDIDFGALFAGMVNLWLPSADLSTVGFAVVGMCALFTAIVRAPLTGIALTIEMTARPDLVLAMLTASLGAVFVATWMGSEPIYESLRERMLGSPPPERRAD